MIAVDVLVKVAGTIPLAPLGFPTQPHVTPPLSAGVGPVITVQLSEETFKVVYPCACGPVTPKVSEF